MSDVSGLVGIDAGVFDQNFLRSGWSLLVGSFRQKQLCCAGAIQAGIDVSSPGNLKFRKPRHVAQCGDDLLSDLAWRLAQLLCQLKAERQRVFPQADIRRLIYHDSRQVQIVLLLQNLADALNELMLKFQVQESAFG